MSRNFSEMTIFPETTQTIILPYTRDELVDKLHRFTHQEGFYVKKDRDSYFQQQTFFRGVISKQHFSIQQLTHTQAHYTPLIKGRIEETQKGCLLFLEYSLMHSSRIMIGSWIFGLSFVFFLFFTAHRYSLYTAIILLLIPLHSLVAHILFRKEVKRIKTLLDRTLFEQS